MSADDPLRAPLSIGAVERDTGLSKDTLRVWERRYGFPMPERDAAGERAYPHEQLHRLRLIKRLLDSGHRPGRVIAMDADALEALAREVEHERHPPAAEVPALERLLGLLRDHDIPALRAQMRQAQLELGLRRFVIELLVPMNRRVGEDWMHGRLQIFEEHLYTEIVQGILRAAVSGAPAPDARERPRVLLATVPGEPHALGLLMAEALLVVQGANCLSLGVQTPLWDIVLAARAQGSDIVALSFTGCMSPNQVIDSLTELRAKLPEPVEIWAGGSAPVLHRRPVAGVRPLDALPRLFPELERWRQAPPR